MTGGVPLDTSALGDALALLFLPLLIAGLVGAWWWRQLPPGRDQTRVQLVAALLFFLPQGLAIVLWNHSASLVLIQELLLATWCLLCLPLAIRSARRRVRDRGKVGVRAVVGAVLAVAVFGGVGAIMTVRGLGDLLLPRLEVSGVATGYHPNRGLVADEVTIGGDRYAVTRDLARQLRPGMVLEGRALHRSRHLVELRQVSSERS